PGTVYQTEIGNKVYFSQKGNNQHLDIFSQTKLMNEWSKEAPLPRSINASGNTNYPFMLTDGVTLYYASDGEGSIGGYDIFVTRYNTNTDSYLTPENAGMPFNSPANDYMYVIDEFNNLGWFASDRYQPEGKVCIYVFIPNSSKQTYDYESMPNEQIVHLAQLRSVEATWKNKKEVTDALQRLKGVIYHQPQDVQFSDFDFIIDDQYTYHSLNDFRSASAKGQFRKYQQTEKSFQQQAAKLDGLREKYAQSSKEEKAQLTPAILDLEKRVEQMSQELDALATNIRKAEKQPVK
ncbi:MAG: hypothetical protein RR365_13185, partial [Bacteroides sp.]